MSSTNAFTFALSPASVSIWSMSRMKTWGAFLYPKGTLVYWNKPSAQMKAVFSEASQVSGTYQNPDFKSKAPKYFAPCMESKSELMSGKGYESKGTVWFSFL